MLVGSSTSRGARRFAAPVLLRRAAIKMLALATALLSIPTLATATTTINIVDANLVARGAGALVSVEVICDFAQNASAFVFMDLFQRAGNRLNVGSGNTGNRIPVACDNTPQILDVLVTPSGRVFKKGPAVVRAFVEVCTEDFSQCESSAATEEVQLAQ
jgi:hypothetical protein